MTFYFLLGIILAGHDIITCITEDRINRITNFYKYNAPVMTNEYDAYGSRDFPVRYYRQVPEIRPYIPYQQFRVEIKRKTKTVSLDGIHEFTIHTYLKYTVTSYKAGDEFAFYMIIAWPRDGSDEFSLLRMYKYESEERKIFLTRSALDTKLLRIAYSTEKKQSAMNRIFVEIMNEPEAPMRECEKAKLTTGTNNLRNYIISSARVAPSSAIPYAIILNNEETYLVSGLLFCTTQATDAFEEHWQKFPIYILADVVRGWVLVRNIYSTRAVTINEHQHFATELVLDDFDENI